MRTTSNGRFYFSVSNRFSLFLLSVTTLLFEINLTRLFSVSQFYHFAFMIVSLALLGIGASGTFLMIFFHKREGVDENLRKLSLGALASILIAYLVINWIPFDTFNISWDSRQIIILAINFLALMLPFFFTGMAVGLLLNAFPREAGKVYAVNLVGSAAGCALALLAPTLVGGEGTVVLSGCFAACAALLPFRVKKQSLSQKILQGIAVCALLLGGMELNARMFNPGTAKFPELKLSPYKSLSYALQYPDAEIISQKWNSYSRIDIIASDSLRSLPGISFQYSQPPPRERGLFIDGDHFNPVVVEGASLEFTNHLPTALAYHLKPNAKTLILEPRGGIDILVAINEGAGNVTVAEENSLVVSSLPEIYRQPGIVVNTESARSALRRSQDQYDLIHLSLSQTYIPVGSGAYSLGENYSYTVEAFQDAMQRLTPDGIFVVSRWLQMPPSEWLRTFILAVTALENLGGDPAQQIVALRSFNTGMLFIKNSPLSQEDLGIVREFAAQRGFDLVYLPDIQPQEVNNFALLQEPIYYQTFTSFLSADSRTQWLERYPYDVSPPTDDHPFFGHYFKWSQAGEIIAGLGKTWQPFGGAGYLVVLVLLALALILSLILIFLPLVFSHRVRTSLKLQTLSRRRVLASMAYFSLIGFAYLLIEIPFFQTLILFLGQPTYALTIVLFSILLFSGIGSQLSGKFDVRRSIVGLILLVFVIMWGLPAIIRVSLGFNFILRVLITVLVLAPLGVLMGMPFPGGIMILEEKAPGLIPWVWGINGAASVLASILSMLLALSFGFKIVLVVGALCYLGAWCFIPRLGLI